MLDFLEKCKGNKEKRKQQKELEKAKRKQQKELEKAKKLEENQELADRVVAYLMKKDNGKKEFKIFYREFYDEFPEFKCNLEVQQLVYHQGWMMWNYGPFLLVKRIPIPDPDDKRSFFIT